MFLVRWIFRGFGAAGTLGVIAAVAASVIVAALWFLTSLPVFAQFLVVGATVVFLTCVLLAVIESVRAAVRDRLTGSPRLAFGDPYTMRQDVIQLYRPPPGVPRGAATAASASQDTAISQSKGEGAWFAYAPVVNRTKNLSADCTAKEAVVQLDFFDMLGKPLLSERGRWANSKNPLLQPVFSSTSEFDRWTIPANGDAEPIDIAYKFEADPSCYVFTNESARRGFRDPRTKISEGEFRVVVTVRGSNFADLKSTFIVRHQGRRSKLEIRPDEDV